jgi:hypothetical protein
MEEDEYNDIVTYINILSGGLFGQYFNIKFLPMLLYIFQMRWKKFDIKIYPWITLHIIVIKKYFTSTYLFVAMLIN